MFIPKINYTNIRPSKTGILSEPAIPWLSIYVLIAAKLPFISGIFIDTSCH
jgi:hypothetical protein